jgi:hypothetical protein
MIAGIYKITCDQGATFERSFTIYAPKILGEPKTPVDLTGYSARMQVRPEKDSPNVLIEITTDNGGIAIDGPSGVINLTIEADVTSTIDRDGVYDLEIYNTDGKVYRVIKGPFALDPEVTRDGP